MINLLGLVSQAAKEQSTASATGYVKLKVRCADPTNVIAQYCTNTKAIVLMGCVFTAQSC